MNLGRSNFFSILGLKLFLICSYFFERFYVFYLEHQKCAYILISLGYFNIMFDISWNEKLKKCKKLLWASAAFLNSSYFLAILSLVVLIKKSVISPIPNCRNSLNPIRPSGRKIGVKILHSKSCLCLFYLCFHGKKNSLFNKWIFFITA